MGVVFMPPVVPGYLHFVVPPRHPGCVPLGCPEVRFPSVAVFVPLGWPEVHFARVGRCMVSSFLGAVFVVVV